MYSRTGPPAGGHDSQVVWPVRCGALPPLADGFGARPETMPGLRAALAAGVTVVLAPEPLAASGARDWPGTRGKTQLAVSVAEELWAAHEVDLLVWITATSRVSILAGLVAASAAATGISPAGDSEPVASRFVGWLSETSKRWLVVLDGLSSPADLTGLWPHGRTGMTLITTADPANVPVSSPALVLPVGAFSTREALSYLMGRLTADTNQRVGAIDLIEEAGCEPLGLAQASAVIASSSQSCRDYCDQFVQRRQQMAGPASTPPPPGAITWTLCVDRAEQLSPGGTCQFLLVLGALLDGHEIPGAVFTAKAADEYLATDGGARQAGQERVWDELATLERVGLLSIDPENNRAVRMNPVVQAAIRSVIPKQMFDRAALVAAASLLEIWPEDEPAPWSGQVLRSCTANLQRIAGDTLWAGGCHPLLLRAGRSLDDARLCGPAVTFWKELATAGERILGRAHPDTLFAGQQLASAYLAAGQPAEAVAWFEWALSASVRVFGPDHPGNIAARVSLGRALLAAGRPADAIPVLAEAVAMCERVRGPDHLETIDAREEYAAACRGAQRFTEACASYRRTLADRERLQGSRHPDSIATRETLAAAQLADGQVKAAVSQLKRAVADRERVSGQDHPATLTARSSLAGAYLQAGRLAAALQLFEGTNADSERLLGADHPDTLMRRASLANTYYCVGRLADAQTLLEDTAKRCERVLPPDDPLTRAVRKSLADFAGR